MPPPLFGSFSALPGTARRRHCGKLAAWRDWLGHVMGVDGHAGVPSDATAGPFDPGNTESHGVTVVGTEDAQVGGTEHAHGG